MTECQAKDDGTGWVKCDKCRSHWSAPAWNISWRKCQGGISEFAAWVPVKTLSDYTDEEIAKEYFWRAQQKLGDPRVGVGPNGSNL